MHRFANLIVKFRIGVIFTTLVVTAGFTVLLPRLRIDSDILNYLPESDPAVRLFNDVGTQFAGNSSAIIAIETEDVFTARTIQRIHLLTEKIREIAGVSHVTSLTDVLDIRMSEYGLEISRLIDKYRLPTEPEELAVLRSYTLGKDLFTGRIISEDGTVALIMARIQEDANRTAVADEIAAVVREMDLPETVYYAGMPFQMGEIQKIVVKDLRYLIPLVSLLIIIMLAFSFRSISGVVFPLLTVLFSTIWTLGVMALVGVPLTIISNITPVILIAVGSAYGIHLVSRFFEESENKQNNSSLAAHGALTGVGIPIVLTGVTTLVAFLSFTGSYLIIIKHFGFFTALGVFFSMVLAITFLPAILSFSRGRTDDGSAFSRSGSTGVLDRVTKGLSGFILRRKHLILGAAIVAAALSSIGLTQLKREVDMIEYFPPGSSIRTAEHLMEEKFGGSLPIRISIHGDLLDPQVLKEMWKLEKMLETIPAIYKPQSIADLLAEMNYLMNGRYSIPNSREEIGNLWFLIDGEETLEMLVDNDRSWGLIQATMASVNTETIREIVDRLEEYITDRLDKDLVTVDLGAASPATGTLALQIQRDRITDLLSWDIAGQDVAEAPSPERISEILSLYQTGGQFPLESSERSDLEERITKFYSEDLAHVAVRSADAVALNLSDLASGTTPEVEEVMETLRANRHPADDEPDAWAISSDGDALQTLILEARGDFLSNRALSDIMDLLPKQLQDDVELRKRLHGNLWELNYTDVLLPADRTNPQSSMREIVPLAVHQTGIPLLYTHLDTNLVKTQIVSLFLTAGLVFCLLAIQFRSLAAGALGIIPLTFVVLINFGVMSLAGVALDTATILVSSIAIGIGIDYTIHFLSRLRAEVRLHHQTLSSLDNTLKTTGRAILVNAISVASGFLALVLASIVPVRHFGWLTALTMVSSAVAALCILPAIILILRPRFIGSLSANNSMSGSNPPDPGLRRED